jgi:hypothetical protein
MMAVMTERQGSQRAGWRDKPHSRACGMAVHEHGASCSRDCPTCGGQSQELGLSAPETAHVQVVLDGTGAHGTVVVDGHDMSSRVKAVHLTARAGAPAQVVLEANAEGFSYEGPGVVKVVEQVAAPWKEQTDSWLAGLDPARLQVWIAEGTMSQPLGGAVIAALRTELDRA